MHVLFVCTGNICRSPVGERVTTAFAAESGWRELTASSSGTSAVVGSGMDPKSARALSDLGGDPSGFVARQFTGAHAEHADLVLTMTRSHRREVLHRAPGALSRTFTLLEAAALLQYTSPDLGLPPEAGLTERGAALVAALGRQRAVRGAIDDDRDDVWDPIGRRAAEHTRAADQISEALFPLLQAACGIGLVGSR